MESQSTSINTLIAQAKQAVLDGNAALARELAEQVLAADPENIAAMLLMAGLSEPQQSVIWLRKVLDLDPQNQTAREGMLWASTQLRQSSAVGWQKEPLPVETAPVVPAAELQAAPKPKSKRRLAWGWAFGTLLIAALLLGLYSIGIIRSQPAAGAQFLLVETESVPLKPSLTPTNTATPTNTPHLHANADPHQYSHANRHSHGNGNADGNTCAYGGDHPLCLRAGRNRTLFQPWSI